MRESLPRDVVPEHYDLRIAVSESVFHGEVRIAVRPMQEVSRFALNSRDLSLLAVEVDGESVAYEARGEELEIELRRGMREVFELRIEYEGAFDGRVLDGFYRSEYRGEPLYSTHFEPTDARRAFPCFDQPDMKATFSVTLETPPGYVALSNGALERKEGENVYVFAKTPVMSTYIVAFVVGRLAYREEVLERAGDRPGVPIRVYAHEAEVAWGDYALGVARRCLGFFERYFELEYPLPKLDMVAIPSFSMGAMENWGLVTYRSTSLLYDAATTSVRAKKNIAVTVCHELAHMWFGNLVTMAWWDDLWLNEGFATWAATLAIAEALRDVLPWDAWTSFVSDEIESGMAMDSLRSTHRIGIAVERPVEIDQIFDAISYSKGSAIIRMVESWLGPETFRKGLVHYLSSHRYANSTTAGLWNSLGIAYRITSGTDVDIPGVIGPWINREGFPLITATPRGDRLELEQTRFSLGTDEEHAPWPIPVRILWSDGVVTDFVMLGRTAQIERRTPVCKINDQVAGFYRVLYKEEAGSDPIQQILAMELSAANRMQLFNDAFAAARALRGPLPLTHASALSAETNFDVLAALTNALQKLASIFYDNDAFRSAVKRRILGIVGDRSLGVNLSDPGTTINDVACNSLLVSKAVTNGHRPTIERLAALLQAKADAQEDPTALLNDPASVIHPEFIRQLYSAVANDHFDALFAIYKGKNSIGLKQHAIIALGSVSKPDLIQRLLDSYSQVLAHDSIYLFSALGANYSARNAVASFFARHFYEIRAHIKADGLVRYAIESVFSNVLEPQAHREAVAFLDSIHSDPALVSAVDKCIDSLEEKTRFRKFYLEHPEHILTE